MKNTNDISKLFDDLALMVTGKATGNIAGFPAKSQPPAPESRCSMCALPGKNHTSLLACVADMRVKMATLTGDDGYIPTPPQPPIPVGAGQREAYAAYARSQARNVGKVTPRH